MKYILIGLIILTTSCAKSIKGLNIQYKDKNIDLITAIIKGNEEEIRFLLASRTMNVNFKDFNGDTPLMLACKYWHPYKAQFSKKINIIDQCLSECLIESSLTSQVVKIDSHENKHKIKYYIKSHFIIGSLIENKAEINCKDENDKTALMHAIINKADSPAILMLIKSGADINSKDKAGRTALMHAILSKADEEVLKILLKNGANINIRDNDGITALMHAILEERYIRYIKKENYGRFIESFQSTALNLLTKRAESINIQDNSGVTALMYAACKNHTKMASFLISKGADIHLKILKGDFVGYKASKLSRENGFVKIVKVIEDHKKLIIASKEGNKKKIEDLLLEGICINFKDKKGDTALIKASKKGLIEIVELLIEKGADINCTDNCGNTALIWASKKGHNSIVKLLLKKEGTYINYKNNAGMSAISYAFHQSNNDILYPLLEREKNLLSFSFNFPSEGRKVILLLGSLGTPNASYMYYLKKALTKGRHGLIIDDIEIKDTFKSPLFEQADIVFSRLQKEGITQRDKIAIIGHSQGGLRGYALYKKYSNQLNILGLFTLSSPWGGAKILEHIPRIKSQVEDFYKFIKDYAPHQQYGFKKCLDFLEPLANKENLGVQDLKKNSPFFQAMNSFKAENKAKISIYSLRGGERDIFKSSLILFPDASIEIKNAKKEIVENSVKLPDEISTLLADAALLVPLLPFRFLAGVFYGNPNKIPLLTELNVNAKRTLEKMKEWIDINKKLNEFIGSEEHDGILSSEEQMFNYSLEEENMIIDEFFIEDAYHGPIEYPEEKEEDKEEDRKKIKKAIKRTKKAIYNHPRAIEYINEKLRPILRKE